MRLLLLRLLEDAQKKADRAARDRSTSAAASSAAAPHPISTTDSFAVPLSSIHASFHIVFGYQLDEKRPCGFSSALEMCNALGGDVLQMKMQRSKSKSNASEMMILPLEGLPDVLVSKLEEVRERLRPLEEQRTRGSGQQAETKALQQLPGTVEQPGTVQQQLPGQPPVLGQQAQQPLQLPLAQAELFQLQQSQLVQQQTLQLAMNLRQLQEGGRAASADGALGSATATSASMDSVVGLLAAAAGLPLLAPSVGLATEGWSSAGQTQDLRASSKTGHASGALPVRDINGNPAPIKMENARSTDKAAAAAQHKLAEATKQVRI